MPTALLVWALTAVCAAAAAAQPGTGPRETVDQGLTTTRPNAPTGFTFTGRYHAAGDPEGEPPFLRRMVFYPPRGLRYDTSVPERCTASDLELELQGAAACPEGSRIGGGTTEGVFYAPVADGVVFDRYTHTVDVMNNEDEQIVLVNSEGSTVVRGRLRPDGSLEFVTTTCFPSTKPMAECPDDYVLQLGSSTNLPPYTRTENGRVRSYATTPPTCPARGYWKSVIRFWWADGSEDAVATRQPCSRPRKRHRGRR
ncbi:MAG TPA: hypothetical protein VF520_03040 [Thermoleophilaceae bacterium]